MKKRLLTLTVLTASIMLAGPSLAHDKKNDPMMKDAMMKSGAMMKDAMKKDDAMMKDAMKKDDAMIKKN